MIDADDCSPTPREMAARAIARTTARDLARKHTPAAIRYLAAVMKDGEANHADRIKAAQELLNRAWGRPTEDVTHRVAGDSAPLRVRWMTSTDDD